MIILAVDYGDARTGVAVCDKMEILAVPVCVINESYEPKLIDKLDLIIKEKKPELLVVGLPKNMDGSLGFRAQACSSFAEKLSLTTGVKHEMWDERLTSVIAHNNLRASGKKEIKHKANVDAAAAVEILQSYIDRKRK